MQQKAIKGRKSYELSQYLVKLNNCKVNAKTKEAGKMDEISSVLAALDPSELNASISSAMKRATTATRREERE